MFVLLSGLLSLVDPILQNILPHAIGAASYGLRDNSQSCSHGSSSSKIALTSRLVTGLLGFACMFDDILSAGLAISLVLRTEAKSHGRSYASRCFSASWRMSASQHILVSSRCYISSPHHNLYSSISIHTTVSSQSRNQPPHQHHPTQRRRVSILTDDLSLDSMISSARDLRSLKPSSVILHTPKPQRARMVRSTRQLESRPPTRYQWASTAHLSVHILLPCPRHRHRHRRLTHPGTPSSCITSIFSVPVLIKRWGWYRYHAMRDEEGWRILCLWR